MAQHTEMTRQDERTHDSYPELMADNATREDILVRICDYLRQSIERPLPASLSATTHLVTDLHLDSMEGAQMLSDLEDHYGVTIDVRVLQRAATLGDVAAAVVSALEAGRQA